MAADPLDDLSDLLEEERRLILTGGFAALGAIAPRKAACLSALSEGASPERLAPLARALARNQGLLAAALEGVREALRRRAAVAASRSRLVTYDARGARAEHSTAPGRVERKA